MQIVIEIDDDDYNRMKDLKMFGNEKKKKNAICNSTPLPKGHGDLIDRRSFRENIDMCLPFTKYWQDHNPQDNRTDQ